MRSSPSITVPSSPAEGPAEGELFSVVTPALLTPDVWVFLTDTNFPGLARTPRGKTSPTSDTPHKSRVVTRLTWSEDSPAINQVFPFSGSHVCRHSSQNSGKPSLRSLVYSEGCKSRTVKWQRRMGQGRWEGVQSFPALFGHTSLPAPRCAHPPGSLQNSTVWGFMEFFLAVGD